jgi:hypothetical protein
MQSALSSIFLAFRTGEALLFEMVSLLLHRALTVHRAFDWVCSLLARFAMFEQYLLTVAFHTICLDSIPGPSSP